MSSFRPAGDRCSDGRPCCDRPMATSTEPAALWRPCAALGADRAPPAPPAAARGSPRRRPSSRRPATTRSWSRRPDRDAPGLQERVAMSLGPEAAEADRGRRPDAGQCRGPGLDHVRRPAAALRRAPYEINPTVTARIVLAAAPERRRRIDPALREPQVLCKQRRPNRNHHCTLAIPNLETRSPTPRPSLPGRRLLREHDLGASNKKASRGDRGRPRRRPARRLGRAGQGQAERGPSARRGPGAEPVSRRASWSTTRCR